MDMKRRDFAKAVASFPIVSVPSLPDGEITQDEEEEYWEVSSSWFQRYDHGDLLLVKNGEPEHEWRYENYSAWQKATLLNSHTLADCEYVADLFGLNLHEIYIDSPFFHSVFRGEAGEVRIRQGKYSDADYRYYIRTSEKEKEYGSNSMENMITDIGRKLGEDG